MPTPVDIDIFLISRTQLDRSEVRRWLDRVGVSENFTLPDSETVTDSALLPALGGKRCYKSFEEGLNPNVTKIRKDYGEYLDNVLKQGHGSVLEHSVFTFAIEGVSRVFTGEMNRHRAGWAISEASMRYIRYSESIPYWSPTSIQGPDVADGGLVDGWVNMLIAEIPDDAELVNTLTLEQKKQITRWVLYRAFAGQERYYRVLERVWATELAEGSQFKGKKEITSMMRRIVGMGVATGGIWTGNVRALRHVITMRAAPSAEEEILHVFTRVAKLMRDAEPMLFGDFYQDEAGYWRPKYVKV